jgi:outer membrane protein assembly factor BamE
MLIRNIILRGSILACLLLAGCGSRPAIVLPYFKPYRMDIQQGNVVTQEMISKIQPGMTRSQVRFALGTPLVVDPFRTDRWDYVYQYHTAGVVTEHRKIAVIFKDDTLLRIEGDVVPARPGGAAPAAAAPARPAVATDKPKAAP